MNLHKLIKDLFNDKKPAPRAITKYNETGFDMINSINSTNPDVVLDLGCGNNIYKNQIKNLIGVDILDNNLQDINSPIESLPFEDNYADVVLALGSINFGDEKIINTQLNEVKRVCKNNGLIYFRVMAEHDLDPYYYWTLDKVKQKEKLYNFQPIVSPKYIKRTRYPYKEHDIRTGERSLERIFCIWKVVK